MPGFERSFSVELDDVTIRLMPLPYLLASKMEAFFDRGVQDLYGSHDLEDILYVFNYTTNLVEQVLEADSEVIDYLKESVDV